MTNAEIREIVFEKITELGFKIYDIHNVDGYFLFEGEKDSVTHFRLKGKGMWKHWKFGLWLNAEYLDENFKKEEEDCEYNVIRLFAQHDTWIDKFKPNRSALLFTKNIDQFNDYITGNDKNIFGKSWTFHEMESMLKMMCKHPFMCYDEYCGQYVGYVDHSFLWNYIKYECKDKLNIVQTKLKTMWWLPYTKIKIALCKSKIIKDIELYNFEKENKGWGTNYLYKVRITFSKNATDEEIYKWIDRWWKRDNYGKIGSYDCVVEVAFFDWEKHEFWFN